MADQPDNKENSKRALVTLIGSLLSKYRSQKDSNVKEILMLIAALNMLSVSDDDTYTNSVARRLITGVK